MELLQSSKLAMENRLRRNLELLRLANEREEDLTQRREDAKFRKEKKTPDFVEAVSKPPSPVGERDSFKAEGD